MQSPSPQSGPSSSRSSYAGFLLSKRVECHLSTDSDEMSHCDKNKGVVFPSKLAKLHSRDWVVHLEAVNHILVVEDEDVGARERNCNQTEATTGDFHLLDARDCRRQLLLPHSFSLSHRVREKYKLGDLPCW